MEQSSSNSLIPVTSRNIEIFQWFIIGIVVWVVVSKQIRKYRQANQYGQAGNDTATNQAIAIHQACNPSGLSWLIDLDFTALDDLNSVGDQISSLTDVASAYLNLYNENLFERLEKELSNADFQAWLKRAQSAPVKAPAEAPGTTTQIINLFAVRNTTVFEYSDSTKIAKTVDQGRLIGNKIGAYYITSKGEKQLYYLVEWSTLLGLITYRGYVLAADTKTTA